MYIIVIDIKRIKNGKKRKCGPKIPSDKREEKMKKKTLINGNFVFDDNNGEVDARDQRRLSATVTATAT